VTRFGAALRAFRQASNDPDRLNRRLTQERLGELIGHEMGDFGFSGAAISYWEGGESKISAEDRNVLIALIKVLHRCGGLQTLVDANQFLEVGNYSALKPDEAVGIFGKPQDGSGKEQADPAGQSRPFHPFLLESLFAIFGTELAEALAKAEEGPSPAWPRKVAVLMRTITARVSLSPSSILWTVAWALGWWLIPPSLRWPFADQGSAYSAIIMYIGGTLAVPLLIGLLVTTKDSDYWKQQSLTTSRVLRLYTYQGAGIGFNLGYFFVFPFVLTRYYLGLE